MLSAKLGTPKIRQLLAFHVAKLPQLCVLQNSSWSPDWVAVADLATVTLQLLKANRLEFQQICCSVLPFAEKTHVGSRLKKTGRWTNAVGCCVPQPSVSGFC